MIRGEEREGNFEKSPQEQLRFSAQAEDIILRLEHS